MVYYGRNGLVNLVTTSLTLDRLIIEEYPLAFHEKNRLATKVEGTWLFKYIDFPQKDLCTFLEQINDRLGNCRYHVIRQLSNSLVQKRNSDGKIIRYNDLVPK